jgi:peptidoglycan hydrolase-like protein with peptidoglycan-binding domain
MPRTLKLTSPYLKGEDVRKLQAALKKKKYYNSTVDGQYGPLTAQGVHRAKYWLGYRKPDQTCGALLPKYLAGHPTTPEMKARAARRKKIAAQTPIRLKALKWLTARLGDKERPSGSNRVPWASQWYGIIGPWCAMAVTRAYVESGSRSFARSQRYAYVPYIVNDAHHGRNNLAFTSSPQPGDLVCFDWEGNGVADHVGLFERWMGSDHSTFRSIEGNTAVGNDSNGGEVMRRTRRRSQVQAFVHVGERARA